MSPSPPCESEPKAAETQATESKPEVSRARSRSRSPRRSPPRKPKNFSGLKWKNDKRDDRDRDDRRRDDRGGRERRDYDRDDRRRDDRHSDRRGGDDRRRDDRRGDDRRRDERRGRDDHRGEDRRRDDRDRKPREDRERKPRSSSKDKSKSKDAKPAAPPASNEPMIIVTINDRLGTKTQVPCLPSDPVRVLKMMVAAKIGRPVHEIMLKRQGERPFHDTLSLADYSISNGVQIDLELNTGD
ncbi:ubiquitin-like modifier HUB1 [Parastagonospora nodorum]|nr:ubiquitin-like modifier HUB1 [Parastagonospora nodorum]KAH6011521.1 ubiquitin-like modifier HUB1 [Parastagonospora nodorum]KAH6091022.1 ubiquitin-like modifier HUB1 [Parastagonospora nodorum]KAH6202980.1 ubiquitin-like modifier HUB1 [Parastagonospora nodorum]KAH6337524.1 ubiquitin-like modifier HUB1 [Parastagonospora nodorum]